MTVSVAYLTYLIDQLMPFARVVTRRMFGGVGLYADETFFGLVDDDTVYFKVDDSNRPDYVERGCKAFRPLADEPDTYSMNYFSVPEDVIEDSDQLKTWARKALAVASAAKRAKEAHASRKAARKPAKKKRK